MVSAAGRARFVPNSEVAPVFNRLVDRRDKGPRSGASAALFSRHPPQMRFEKSGIPYGHRPCEIDDHPNARGLLLFDDGIPEACRSFDS